MTEVINSLKVEEAKSFALKQGFSSDYVYHCFYDMVDDDEVALINYEGSRFDIRRWGHVFIEGDVTKPMRIQGKCIR